MERKDHVLAMFGLVCAVVLGVLVVISLLLGSPPPD